MSYESVMGNFDQRGVILITDDRNYPKATY
jgi:hypothetical protein